MPQPKVYIGYDERGKEACRVAAKTLKDTSQLDANWLRVDRLRDAGLLDRPTDLRGQRYDLVSNAPASTEFALSRFMTPILAQEGLALFVDCDVVFMRDVRELFDAVDPAHAVSVVKHDFAAGDGEKMAGQAQTSYPRKAWSSVCVFNVDHPANRRLTLSDVNKRTGLYLHAFGWLADEEIGGLDPAWNWLCGVQPRPVNVGIAHLTLGGPWLPGWQGGPYDELWREAADA